MVQVKFRAFTTVAALTLLTLSIGCGSKKTARVAPPPPPPPLPAPTATIAATPDTIQQGQATTLTWQTANASEITIEGLGTVPASGSRTMTPEASQTFTLSAKGPGGAVESSARITVNPVAAAPVAAVNTGDPFAASVRDVFFEFDDSRLRSDEALAAQNDGRFLSQHPDIRVLLEGHCDDRGSEMYNLALGERRASSLRETLIQQGVEASRIRTVSYGKEKPFCSQESEDCWQQNRRDHIVRQP